MKTRYRHVHLAPSFSRSPGCGYLADNRIQRATKRHYFGHDQTTWEYRMKIHLNRFDYRLDASGTLLQHHYVAADDTLLPDDSHNEYTGKKTSIWLPAIGLQVGHAVMLYRYCSLTRGGSTYLIKPAPDVPDYSSVIQHGFSVTVLGKRRILAHLPLKDGTISVKVSQSEGDLPLT